MWKKRESVLVDLYKNPTRDDTACSANGAFIFSSLTKTKKDPSLIYPGSDFDVFGKEKTPPAPFTAFCNIDPYILKPSEPKEEIVIAHGFKRGQLEALLDSTAIIKKRKVKQVHGPDGVFFKSTAPYNTPSNIFMTHNNQHWEDPIDLEYC